MRRRTSLLAAALTLVMVLAVANSASAAEPNGVKTNETLCSPFAFGTICTDASYVDITATTPSGLVSYTRNGTATTTVTFTSGPNAGCTFTGASNFRHHLLLKPGETEFDFPVVQVIADKTEASLTRACTSVTKFCGTISHTHRVGPDYDFQFQRFEIIGDCGP